MKIGVSPLTNTIFAGNTRKSPKGPEIWTKKEDITDQAIVAVFEWMMKECKKGGTGLFEVKYPDVVGRMIFDLRPDEKQELPTSLSQEILEDLECAEIERELSAKYDVVIEINNEFSSVNLYVCDTQTLQMSKVGETKLEALRKAKKWLDGRDTE